MTKVLGFIVVFAVSVVQVIYNTWAVVLVWNTWLAHYHVATWGEVIGLNLMLGWLAKYRHVPEEEKEAFMLGYFRYELLQPVLLVLISTVLKWWLS